MTRKSVSRHHATLEGIRQTDADGNEFWSARDLAPLLDYVQWRNFAQVVEKARLACRQAGNRVADHFADVSKMVGLGSGAQREVDDVHLSRYACYLIVQNGDQRRRTGGEPSRRAKVRHTYLCLMYISHERRFTSTGCGAS